eukprot:scaffold52_cov526-Pavlova_lutheri.AAC.2
MEFTTQLGLHSQTTRLDERASWSAAPPCRRGSHPLRRPVPGNLGRGPRRRRVSRLQLGNPVKDSRFSSWASPGSLAVTRGILEVGNTPIRSEEWIEAKLPTSPAERTTNTTPRSCGKPTYLAASSTGPLRNNRCAHNADGSLLPDTRAPRNGAFGRKDVDVGDALPAGESPVACRCVTTPMRFDRPDPRRDAEERKQKEPGDANERLAGLRPRPLRAIISFVGCARTISSIPPTKTTPRTLFLFSFPKTGRGVKTSRRFPLGVSRCLLVLRPAASPPPQRRKEKRRRVQGQREEGG